MTDEQFASLLVSAQAGGDAAWAELVRDVGPRVLSYARARGLDDPEDLLGEVLVQVVRGLPTFNGHLPGFRAWVLSIAHARIIDAHRRRSRRVQVVTDDVPDVADDRVDPLHGLVSNFVRPEVTAAIESLADGQRDAVLLRVVAGLTTDEVATVLGKRPGSVRVALHRGLERLRVLLEREGVTP